VINCLLLNLQQSPPPFFSRADSKKCSSKKIKKLVNPAGGQEPDGVKGPFWLLLTVKLSKFLGVSLTLHRSFGHLPAQKG
jgi:hypothetical protein